MRNLLTLLLSTLFYFIFYGLTYAQPDPGCPEITINFNTFQLPTEICQNNTQIFCVDVNANGSDISLIQLSGIPGTSASVSADGQICLTAVLGLNGQCIDDTPAPQPFDITLLLENLVVTTTDPVCSTGNVAINVIGAQPPFNDPLISNDVNTVFPQLTGTEYSPTTITVNPDYTVFVFPPDCNGDGGQAIFAAGGVEFCQLLNGTPGQAANCPDNPGIDGVLSYDFTALVPPDACVFGGPIADTLIADCTTCETCDDPCANNTGDPAPCTYDPDYDVCDDGCEFTTDIYNNTTCECDFVLNTPDCDDNDPNTDDSYDEANCICINTVTDIPGCTDPCAINYNPDATVDDGSCELPEPPTLECWETATFNTASCEWDVTGEQPEPPILECYETTLFNDVLCEWEVTGEQPEIDDNCDLTDDSFDEITCIAVNTPNCPVGTFFNASICECELEEILGCTDPCAPNYDPTANTDDSSCEPYDTACNTDCTAGDLTVWDATTCSCVVDVVTVIGCTDPTAANYDATANCDDSSCSFVFDFELSDPCNCFAGLDLDNDGENEFAQETYTFSNGTAPYMVSDITGTLYDNTGTPYTVATLEAWIATNDPGTGVDFDVLVYVAADGISTYSLEVTDSNGVMNETFGGPCTVCLNISDVPTVGEWGLIMLGLLMCIFAVIGIREKQATVLQ